jgi:hypothetical protein
MSRRHQRTGLSDSSVIEVPRGRRPRRATAGTWRVCIGAACFLCTICFLAASIAKRSHAALAGEPVWSPELASPRSVVKPLTLTAQSPPQKNLEVVLVTIERQGIYPKEINLHKTRFILAVDNRAEVRSVTLQLDRADGGGRVDGAIVPLEKLDWRTLVDVPPGHYVLSEANHPEWRCLITTSAN